MRKSDPTNRKFLVGTIVVVAAFCFWPNWLTGLFVLLVVLGWIFHDSHSFTRAVWRTVLSLVLLIGIYWTTIWYATPNMDMTGMNQSSAIAIGLVAIVGSAFCLIRSIRNARKDWTMLE